MIHDTIKQRLRATLLALASGKSALDTAAPFANELNDEGTWDDLHDPDESRLFPVASHLERTLLLAKARHLAPGELDAPCRRAFDWWLSHDFRTDNWYQDQLVVPRLVGEIALLCEDELSLGAWGKTVEILTRAQWTRWEDGEGWKEWSGAPLLGVAHNVLLRGCLEKIPTLCETAFRRAFKYTRWKQPGEEGQNGLPAHFSTFPAVPWADSISLAQDYARLLALAHGTSWQAPAESVRSFVGYLLDFLQWTMRQSVRDAEAPENSAELPRFKALAAAIVHLSQLGNPPRRDELLAMAERLQGHGKPLTGHRSFWRSHVAFHQRPAFYASLRLNTSRSLRPDFAPSSAPAVGGTIYFLRSGQEYAGMQDHWNFRQLPGLTAIQRDAPIHATEATETSRLSGCVSEGEFGVGALEQTAEGLRARKSWFFFDESVVCLDAGIQGPPVSYPVYTSINQCRFQGALVAENAARERFSLSPGQTHDLTSIRRVEHGGFVYYFPAPLRVLARVANVNGNRESPSHGADAVFDLCIDHGLKPAGNTSAYVVLPQERDAAGRDRTQTEISRLDFLSNTPAVQAVGHRGAGLIGATFWEPGVVMLPSGGRIAVNRPCLLLCREHPSGGATLSVSNLLAQPVTVHVEYGGRCVSFELPGGADAGRSLSRQL